MFVQLKHGEVKPTIRPVDLLRSSGSGWPRADEGNLRHRDIHEGYPETKWGKHTLDRYRGLGPRPESRGGLVGRDATNQDRLGDCRAVGIIVEQDRVGQTMSRNTNSSLKASTLQLWIYIDI